MQFLRWHRSFPLLLTGKEKTGCFTKREGERQGGKPFSQKLCSIRKIYVFLTRLENWIPTWSLTSFAVMECWRESVFAVKVSPTELYSRNSDKGEP